MGLEILVAREDACPLAPLLERLAAAGLPSVIVMVDGALRVPDAAPPADWRDARIRTPAGTVALARRANGIAVLVFGNADEALKDVQRRVADALR